MLRIISVAGRVLAAVVRGVARESWFWLAGYARLVRGYTVTTLTSTGWLAVTVWQGWWNLFSAVAGPVIVTGTWCRFWPVSFARFVSDPLWRRRVRRSTRRRWSMIMDTCGLSRRVADVLGGPVTVTVPPLRRLRWRQGLLVAEFRLLSGQTVDHFDSAADPLRVTVGAHRIKIIPNEAMTACSIAWTFGDPLSRPIRIAVPEQEAPVGDVATVCLGVTEDGTAWRHQVRVSTFAAGCSNAGKSSLMNGQLIQLGPAIRAGFVRACGIDLKLGVELAFAAPMLTSYATKPLEAVTLLEQLVAEMEARLERQAGVVRDHTPTVAEPLVLIYVDELAALTAYLTDRDLIRRAEAALSRLLSAGRAAGYIAHGFVQDPRKETVKMRHLFLQAIGLRLRERTEVAMALSDGALSAGAWCHKIPRSMPGVGYVLSETDDRPVRVRGFQVTDDDIRLAASRFPAPHQIPITVPTDQPSAVAGGSVTRARTSRRTTTAVNGEDGSP